jgi:hypothetical protein
MSEQNLQVGDPDDLNRHRRVQRINDARDKVSRIRIESARVDQRTGRILMYKAVKDLALQTEHLIQEYNRNIWTNYQVGSISIDPPSDAIKRQQDRQHRLPPSENAKLSTIHRSVDSLDAFVDLDPERDYHFSFSERQGGQLQQQTFSKRVAVPLDVSTNAERIVTEFLTEVGLEVEITGEPIESDAPLYEKVGVDKGTVK